MTDWDPFATESGLLTDYTLEIHHAEFIYNEKFNRTQMELRGFGVQGEEVVQDNCREWYSVGEGWEILDGGAKVHYPQNAKKRFNVNSQYGQLVTHAVEVGDVWVAKLRENSLSPMDASIWPGTSWEMREFTRGEGEFRSVRNYPVAFVRYLSDKLMDAGPPAELEIAVQECARESADFSDFVTKALAIPNVQTYTSLVNQIADSDYWERIKKG